MAPIYACVKDPCWDSSSHHALSHSAHNKNSHNSCTATEELKQGGQACSHTQLLPLELICLILNVLLEDSMFVR